MATYSEQLQQIANKYTRESGITTASATAPRDRGMGDTGGALGHLSHPHLSDSVPKFACQAREYVPDS